MAHGLQVMTSGGVVYIDISTRISKILGTVSYTTSNGSTTNAGFSDGSAFWIAIPGTEGSSTPSVSVSGTTISWSWDNPLVTKAAGTLLYGIY